MPLFFFFNDTATTEIYTLSLHDALPILARARTMPIVRTIRPPAELCCAPRSEEHTSELQSLAYPVCRLLLEKKKRQLGGAQTRAGRRSACRRGQAQRYWHPGHGYRRAIC